MRTLTETLGLTPILEKYGLVDRAEDFEALYSYLHSSGKSPKLRVILEEAVRDYFSALELPDQLTIYDRLVLGLREKDVIATFNWDPLLFQTMVRYHGKAPLPKVLYLHGNVAIGYCELDRIKGPIQGECIKCGGPFMPSRLLFPVSDKNYAADPLLKAEWASLQAVLQDAYLLTIFGYGAPGTDAKAVEIMKEAWLKSGERGIEEVEIIDIRDEADLRSLWTSFIVGSHYRIKKTFDRSIAARWPRRSCEAIWNQFMMLKISEEYPIPSGGTVSDVQEYIRPFLAPEIMGVASSRAPIPDG
jgi:hypothetical protein